MAEPRPGAAAGIEGRPLADGHVLRRATVDDVPGIAAIMAAYVEDGTLLPRSIGELFRSAREFHVVVDPDGRVLACGALRILWRDLAEVRSLAVRPEAHGRGFGAAVVQAAVEDARALRLPRVIALTREVRFFERCGFTVVDREHLPRKVWTDCVHCPKRHACDEVAVELELEAGAVARARAAGRSWKLPLASAPGGK